MGAIAFQTEAIQSRAVFEMMILNAKVAKASRKRNAKDNDFAFLCEKLCGLCVLSFLFPDPGERKQVDLS